MNTNFGKLTDNRIEFAPSIIVDGEKSISTNDPSVMLAYGYKQIVRTPRPVSEIVKKENYTEDETTITIGWVDDLEGTRQNVLNKIAEYDTSDNVNHFTLGGVDTWLNRDDRVCLNHSIDITEIEGGETYDLCVEGVGVVTLPIQTIRGLLFDIEMYAIACYKTTFEHKEAVKALQTCEELVNYDYTMNYPQKLVFEI